MNLDKNFRTLIGYKEGKENARTILENLDAGETVKIITSSMGAAYERGFSQALVDEAKTMNEEIDSYNEMATAFNAKMDKEIAENPDISKGLEELKIPLKQKIELKIEFVVDLDAFQGSEIPADKNAQSNYYSVNTGSAEKHFVGSAVPGATEIGKDQMKGHHPSNFPSKLFKDLKGDGGSMDVKDVEHPRKTGPWPH